MKKTCVLIILFLYFSTANAQQSALKAGLDLNLWLIEPNKGGYMPVRIPPFGGFKLSYEVPLGKKFSFTYNFEVSRRKAVVAEKNTWSSSSTSLRISFIPEIRYYPLKSPGLSRASDQGLFIQAGVRMFSYYTTKGAYGRISRFTLGGDLWGDNSFLGIGIKHPINPRMGMEMNLNVSPYNLIMQDSWQSLQAGFKIYRLFGKPEKKEKKIFQP
jgi:hypothetical protein